MSTRLDCWMLCLNFTLLVLADTLTSGFPTVLLTHHREKTGSREWVTEMPGKLRRSSWVKWKLFWKCLLPAFIYLCVSRNILHQNFRIMLVFNILTSLYRVYPVEPDHPYISSTTAFWAIMKTQFKEAYCCIRITYSFITMTTTKHV